MGGDIVKQGPQPEDLDRHEIVIRTDGLTRKFGSEIAVQDLSFDIPKGKIFGFIGPSGSGKTTTVRMLTGVLNPTAGQVHVFGGTPAKFTRRTRQRIGYMPQLFYLYPSLSVSENMNFVASLYGMGPSRGKYIRHALELVELQKDRKKLGRDLSGGMQRRLSLAATLVHKPELVFLDEPTTGIDPVLRQKFWEHFKALQQEGCTLFLTTQYVGEAAYCDLIGVLSRGRLLVVDTPDELRRRSFGGDTLELRTGTRIDYDDLQLLRRLPSVLRIARIDDRALRLVVDDSGAAMPAILEWCREHKIGVESFNQYNPPFDDIFVELIKKETDRD
jgi:ABC-2 type transport system ATP-binding protein